MMPILRCPASISLATQSLRRRNIVEYDGVGIQTADNAVELHDRAARERGVQMAYILHRGGRNNEAVHLLLQEKLHGLLLKLLVFITVRDDNPEASPARHVTDAAQHTGVERAFYVASDHANGLSFAGDQSASEAVGTIAKGLGGLTDLLLDCVALHIRRTPSTRPAVAGLTPAFRATSTDRDLFR